MELNKQAAIAELFRRGNVSWKLRKEQKVIYDKIHNSRAAKYVINSSRRWGKSFLLCTICDEYARNNHNISVKYAAPTQKQVREIVKPLFSKLLSGCPEEVYPKWSAIDSCFYYPSTGSKISVVGCDVGRIDRLRGDEMALGVIDEAGMIVEDLNYIIKDILIPQTLTIKKNKPIDGKIILASTPPISPAHAFVQYVSEAELSKDDCYTKMTIYDNSSLDPKVILDYAEEAGCEVDRLQKKITKYSTTFRREYLAEIVTEKELAIFPEFNDETQKEIVMESAMPKYFDAYVSMDVGIIDLTVVLFAYWDFLRSKLVIQDELALNYRDDLNTDKLAKLIREKEKLLWGSKEPYCRVMDNNMIMCQDLINLHKLNFFPSDKDNKEAAVNNVRLLFHARKIEINPRCKTLIAHSKYGVWDKTKTKFERSGEFGHFDACFLPDTKVLTNIGFKKIKDVCVGDNVISHDGKHHEVTNTMNREYSGDVYSITSPRSVHPIVCTPEHPFYVSEFKKSRENELTGQIMPTVDEFKNVSELKEMHRLIQPRIIRKSDVLITKEMCFLYGYYVAEGSLGGNGYQIQFAGHLREKNVIDILTKALYDTYGSGKQGASRRSIRRHALGQFKPRHKTITFKKLVGNSRIILMSEKKLWIELKQLGKSIDKKFPDYICDLTNEQSLYMLCGYLFGDGHFSDKAIKCNTISEHIYDGVRVLLQKLGLAYNCCIFNRLAKSAANKVKYGEAKKQFGISIIKQDSLKIMNEIYNNPDLSFVFEDKIIQKIDNKNIRNYDSKYSSFKIDKQQYSGLVYNLEVSGIASYNVEGFAVHNCDALCYLVRNLDREKNPLPRLEDGVTHQEYYISPDKLNENRGNEKTLVEVFQPQNEFDGLTEIFGRRFR